MGFALTICIQQFSEISVRHLKKPNLFQLCHQVGPLTGLDDGLSHLAGLGPPGTTQEPQVPHLMEALNDLVVDLMPIAVSQFLGVAKNVAQ